MRAWVEEDVGLLEGYNVANWLQRGSLLRELSEVPPFSLLAGERHYATANCNVYEWRITAIRPDNVTYFRLKAKRGEFLLAPFFWLLFLPFNILSAWISTQRATTTVQTWQVIAQGQATLTDRAIVITTSGGPMRIEWNEITAVNLQNDPYGVRIVWNRKSFVLNVRPAYRMAFLVMMRYLALADHAHNFQVPNGFLEFARSHGKIP